MARRFHFARKMVDAMLSRSGYIPNLTNDAIVPGAILEKSDGGLVLMGTLDQLLREDDPLRTRVRAAMDRTRPRPEEGDALRHRIGLKYRSEGSSLVALGGAGTTQVRLPSQTPIELRLDGLIEFSGEQDYLFDTTEPAAWFSFSASEMAAIHAASRRVLRRGSLVVVGAAWVESWKWYASASRSAAIGFTLGGGADASLPLLDFGKLADVAAKAEMQTRFTRGEVLEGIGQNSVAAFRAYVMRRPWLGSPGLRSESLTHGGAESAESEPETVDFLAEPTLDDVLD